MRTASGLRAILCSLLLPLFGAGERPARAADRDQDLFIRPGEQRSVLFASVDAGGSVFVTAGAKQTLVGPLDRTGFVLMESSGIGVTRERYGGSDLPATRFTTQTSILVGHQWNGDGVFVAGLIGPELEHEQLTVAHAALPFSKPRYGARAQAELWANPVRDALITGTIVGSSAHRSLWARGSTGYRVAGDLFVGPEAVAYVTDGYREIKLGIHATGLSLGIVQGRVSAGWTMTNDNRRGSPYVGLSAWIRM